MSAYMFLKKTYSNLIWLILPLSIISLLAELLPEIEAKTIVIPTLILMIALCIIEISKRGWNTIRSIKRSFR
jgi:hypothetical protein